MPRVHTNVGHLHQSLLSYVRAVRTRNVGSSGGAFLGVGKNDNMDVLSGAV